MSESDCPVNDHERDRSLPPLRCDFLVDTEVLFDRGDALKGVIYFFLEAGDVLDFFSEIVEITADQFEFALYTCQLSSEVRDVFLRRHRLPEIDDVVLRRHVLDDVSEHFAEFFECRVLCCHIREV
jgi:hypothetical protein